ncbi:MAG: 3-hydroxyacyl-CoA dehydrogenase NAD-binding protein, partial [Humibacillus sp.]|nr:3-hydroxyacyl-CoA dehydrogenase NAD-binding protein [Humibacillus sp.]
MSSDGVSADDHSARASILAPVGVVGAGAMGSGIAQVAALAGHRVLLVDTSDGAAASAVERIGVRLDRLAAQGRLEPEQADAARELLSALDTVDDLPDCGLVIEAAPEDLDLKQRLFADLSERQPSTTVLATNTSSIDIDAIARDVTDPERVLGLHFFNPPPVMRLVEVVHGSVTSPAYVEHAMALMGAWGKTPVRCASTPGFIVNRVARPFYGEAQRLVEAGVADAATVDW